MSQSKLFTKLDLSSGYWHVQLDRESSLLTTFQTCFGRYRWCRLPFGLSVSSEIFQKKLCEAIGDLPGVVCITDDLNVHGKTQVEHDERLDKLLSRCKEVGIKLSKSDDKLQYCMPEISFMGHLITREGVKSDPEKVKAVTEMPAPQNVGELKRFLGMVNYLSKYLPNLSDVLHPLLNLTKKDVPWIWSEFHQSAFERVKVMVTSTPILAFYDVNKELTLENDASEYGLGSVLLQEGRPVAFASRSLSSSEMNYAQIEKEMLAITFGLEKFHTYTFGRDVRVITDHKPLTSIMKKPLSKAPKRLQAFLLRTQAYTFELVYKPGQEIPVADTISFTSKEQYRI